VRSEKSQIADPVIMPALLFDFKKDEYRKEEGRGKN
jgi:hypothetical protein